jgi:DNA-binding transcriptional regulator YbjK
MGLHPVRPADWSARLELMIDQYRAATRRRRLQTAMKRWRVHEARQALAALEKPPERVH